MNAKSAPLGENAMDAHGRGRTIDEFLIEEDISLLNYDTPTYYYVQHNTTSLIDLSICLNDCLIEFNLTVLPDLCESDHYPIVKEIAEPVLVAGRPDSFKMMQPTGDFLTV